MMEKEQDDMLPARLPADDRALEAFNLRRAGVSYAAIAAELELADASEAVRLVKGVIEAAPLETPDELRRLEAARLDEMLVAVSEGVLSGDLNAVAAALRIQERRARLLGLDLKGGDDGGAGKPKIIETAAAVVLEPEADEMSVDDLMAEGDRALAEIAEDL